MFGSTIRDRNLNCVHRCLMWHMRLGYMSERGLLETFKSGLMSIFLVRKERLALKWLQIEKNGVLIVFSWIYEVFSYNHPNVVTGTWIWDFWCLHRMEAYQLRRNWEYESKYFNWKWFEVHYEWVRWVLKETNWNLLVFHLSI